MFYFICALRKVLMAEEKLSFPSTSVLIPLGALLKSEDSKDLKETVAAERREIRENK